MAKRIMLLVGLAAIIVLAAVGFIAVLRFRIAPSLPIQTQITILTPKPLGPVPVNMVRVAATPTSPQHAILSLTNSQPPTSSMLPVVSSISGCTILPLKSELRIVFNQGLFSSRCEFSESASQRLGSLAGTLRTTVSNCLLVVEGHTDAAPLSRYGPYKDNYALGLARAMKVAEALRTEHALDHMHIMVTSDGEQNPPFIGATETTDVKNRTVVIRLLPGYSETTGTK
jgi:outer membrane protein OmpA-like peptidoglycan-associated protein